MTNFVTPLHSLCGFDLESKPSNRYVWRNLSSQARLAIEMWRFVAISLFVDPMSLAVPIASLCKVTATAPDYYVISDAGPNKFGFAMSYTIRLVNYFGTLHWPGRLIVMITFKMQKNS